MRLRIILFLFVLILHAPVFALDESSSSQALVMPDGSIIPSEDWVTTVTDNTVIATSSIAKIKADTPEKEMNVLLKTSLLQVQKMRESVKPYGLIVESFSVNIGVPPSVTVSFKFVD